MNQNEGGTRFLFEHFLREANRLLLGKAFGAGLGSPFFYHGPLFQTLVGCNMVNQLILHGQNVVYRQARLYRAQS